MKRGHGFTVVEAIVGIGVVAILAGLIIPVVVKALRDARNARARNDVHIIAAALAHQLRDTGRRPRGQGPDNSNGAGGAIWHSEGVVLAAAPPPPAAPPPAAAAPPPPPPPAPPPGPKQGPPAPEAGKGATPSTAGGSGPPPAGEQGGGSPAKESPAKGGGGGRRGGGAGGAQPATPPKHEKFGFGSGAWGHGGPPTPEKGKSPNQGGGGAKKHPKVNPAHVTGTGGRNQSGRSGEPPAGGQKPPPKPDGPPPAAPPDPAPPPPPAAAAPAPAAAPPPAPPPAAGANNTFRNLFSWVRTALTNSLFGFTDFQRPGDGTGYFGPYLTEDMADKKDPWGNAYLILGYNADGEACGGPIWVVCAGPAGTIDPVNL
jgi:type II secretory pathway pseudopilin PulG